MQYWSFKNGIKMYEFGDDSFGILAYLGHKPTAADMARCFERTAAGVWGNILNGQKATGIYAEIIQGIKKFGFQEFILKYNDSYSYRFYSKNKSARHLRKGRKAKERVEIEKKRFSQVEPHF